ncbi:MAG: Fic family protein [Candidatus Eremiobacteraeota bacterium]|nr:Fic family protein [Candidatus Eremiobacteraeota bacterium]
MKIPKSPPDWRQILAEANPEGLSRFFRLSTESAATDRYHHWDKLRFYKPPAGLTREEWWAALKLRRASQYQSVGLIDKKGKPFVFLVPNFAHKTLHRIDQHAGGELLMSDLPTEETRSHRIVSSLIEEAITSSQLEGAAVTREVAKKMLRTGRDPVSKDERMILNNYLTMRELERLKDEPLSEGLVFEIHRMITQHTLKEESQAGRFRTNQEQFDIGNDFYDEVYHVPPLADELPERLYRMCEFANSGTSVSWIHPVVRSIVLHFWLAYDHPFIDGNGRTARALFYWSMLRHGYWLVEFVTISRILNRSPGRYYKAFLHTETDDNDLTYFIVHQLDVLQTAIDELREYLRRKQHEMVDGGSLIKRLLSVNLRQRNLLAHALRHPHAEYSFAIHRDYHGISQQTSRTDLQSLADLGLLVRSKVGREFVYSPVENLIDKIKEFEDNGI